MTRPHIIAPSLLAADFSKLGQEIADVINAGADWIHIDIMDGHFVPNITFGPDLIRSIRPKTSAFFDAHLMIAPCDPYIDIFARAGCDGITVHAEAGPHLHRSLQLIRQAGKKVGVSLNPATSEHILEYILDAVDLILLMTVNPGFGRQIFLPEMLKKIQRVRVMIGQRPIDLEVDGGITIDTIGQVAAVGANVCVVGSAIYEGNDKDLAYYKTRIAALREEAKRAVSSSHFSAKN